MRFRGAESPSLAGTAGIAAFGTLLMLAGACADGAPPLVPAASGGTTASGGGPGTGGTPTSGTGGDAQPATGGTTGTGGAGGALCEPQARLTMGTHEILNVTWPAGAATLEGRGQVHLWGKVMFAANGNALSGSTQACGTVVPATELDPSIGGGKIMIDVPLEAWDASTMPPFPIDGTQTGWNVGSSLSYTYTASVGFTPVAATTEPWPASYAAITTNDFDHDMNPGVTGVPRSGGGYLLPPTSAVAAVGAGPRADKVYLVDRNVASVMLTRTSCDEAAGTEVFMHFDNHVVGCRVSAGGDCTPSQVKFVDDNRSIYTVTSATIKATAIKSDATCADVRRALPAI